MQWVKNSIFRAKKAHSFFSRVQGFFLSKWPNFGSKWLQFVLWTPPGWWHILILTSPIYHNPLLCVQFDHFKPLLSMRRFHDIGTSSGQKFNFQNCLKTTWNSLNLEQEGVFVILKTKFYKENYFWYLYGNTATQVMGFRGRFEAIWALIDLFQNPILFCEFLGPL